MKYIIPENKLDNIIFKYLDLNLKGIEKKKSRFGSGFVFTLPNEKFGVLSWFPNNNLNIYAKLMYSLSSAFSLNHFQSKSVIGRWVEDRFGLKVISTTPIDFYSQWQFHHESSYET